MRLRFENHGEGAQLTAGREFGGQNYHLGPHGTLEVDDPKLAAHLIKRYGLKECSDEQLEQLSAVPGKAEEEAADKARHLEALERQAAANANAKQAERPFDPTSGTVSKAKLAEAAGAKGNKI